MPFGYRNRSFLVVDRLTRGATRSSELGAVLSCTSNTTASLRSDQRDVLDSR